MKKSKVKAIPVASLRINEGQLDWLPKNPREWTQTDIDRMKRSMDEDPDFAEERPVLAVPGPEDTFVVFCHNLLTRAAQERGDKTLPAVVYEPENEDDRRTILRRALKDNGAFGSWDTDELASWPVEVFELEEWGIPEWITGGAGKAQQTPPASADDKKAGSGAEQPKLEAWIKFPDAESLEYFMAKYAPEIKEEYNAEIFN